MSIHEELLESFDEEILERATQTVQKQTGKEDYEDFSEPDWQTVKALAEEINDIVEQDDEEMDDEEPEDGDEEGDEEGDEGDEEGDDAEEANEPMDAGTGEAPDVDELDMDDDDDHGDDSDADADEVGLLDQDELESNAESFLEGEIELDEALNL